MLRVLIANERLDRLSFVADVVESLGHVVVARSVSVGEVAATTARERPDVAIVGLGDSTDHALGLISEIVRESYCPVIALLAAYDEDWVHEAADRGAYAYIIEAHASELQSAIDITLRRFAEVQSLRAALERRTQDELRATEHAKARRRQALELHDDVVQGLVAAQLAHDLDRPAESREALAETLVRAKEIVNRSLDELRADGLSSQELIEGVPSGRVRG